MPLPLPAPLRRGLIPLVAITAHLGVAVLLVTPRAAHHSEPRVAAMSVSLAPFEAPRTEPAETRPPTPLPAKPLATPPPRPTPTRVAARDMVIAAPAAEAAAEAPAVPAAAPSRPEPPAAPAAESAPPSAPRFDADYLQNPRPDYPSLSRRLGEQGRVVLRVHVESSGTAGQVELHRSSGFSRLDEAALQAVRRWKFIPARRGNEAVAEWVLVPIPFILH